MYRWLWRSFLRRHLTNRPSDPTGAGHVAAGSAAQPHCPQALSPAQPTGHSGRNSKRGASHGSPQLLSPASERGATSPQSFSLDDSGVRDPKWPRLRCEKAPLRKDSHAQTYPPQGRREAADAGAPGLRRKGPAPQLVLELHPEEQASAQTDPGSLGVLHKR